MRKCILKQLFLSLKMVVLLSVFILPKNQLMSEASGSNFSQFLKVTLHTIHTIHLLIYT